jgi:pimeloyl-ACP methyl ester carboxylesterase
MSRGRLAVAGFAGLLLFVALASAPDRGATAPPVGREAGKVRIWTIHYRAHTGAKRTAYVALPAWYGPSDNPIIPLVISPHGRGVGALTNVRRWGALPARGTFAVISPDGAGRRLDRYSWGAVGQVDDMARMPEILRRALPWVRIDRQHLYAFGGSMGGQEVLLLLARYPTLLAGVAAFDAVTDFARQYRAFPRIPCNEQCTDTWNGPLGVSLQSLARREVGGPPGERRGAYQLRSPLTYARTIAGSCVPLQLWWSTNDRVVTDQAHQTGALFDEIRAINPRAPVQGFVGGWAHSAEMRATTRLPAAAAAFGLIPPVPARTLFGIRVHAPPERSCRVRAEPGPPLRVSGVPALPS